ncbi:MAG: AAA family ATPase, partial [Frateuria sp.]|nr:AAA family ATPase [Frateuria sp.]
PPLAVKGIDDPVRSYLVAAATTRGFLDAGRGLDGVSTRMVGRSAELSALQDVFRAMLARQGGEARAAVVTVVGDAGIGKSRLLREFDAWMQARRDAIHLFRGRATPQMQYQPFGLLRDILVRRFQITDGDGTEVALGKLEAAIVPLFLGDDGAELAEGHAHVLAHLVGIDTASRHLGGVRDNAKQLRNRAFHVGAQLLRRLVSRDGRPAVLELEDLHWADNETLDFLDYVAAVDRDVALLVLASTRPQLFERRSDWTGSERVHLRVDLAPLDKTGSRMLADELLQKLPDVPSVLRELVTGGAEGNPFYMEELVRMLVDQGAIQTGPAWTLNAERLLVTRVPPTLSGVLQARLDGLPADERSTLQAASVIGPVFWEKALLAIDSRAARTLPSLVARGLVLRQGDAAPEGLHDHAFRHQLLQQVAYDTLLKRPRRELHGKVARWLAEGHDARGSGDLLGITADHFERAGDRANATEFHARAAAHAAGRMAHEAVATHVDRALALLAGNDDPEVRWRLLVARNESLGSQGRRDEQAVTQEAMEALAAALGDDRKRARALLRRSGRAMEMSDLREQESAALDAIACAERAGDDESRLHAMRHLANARVSRGDLATGEALLQEVLVETRRLGFRHVEALTLNTLSVVADARGDATELLALTRQILAICQDTGDLRGEMASLGNLGTAWLSLGQLAEARRWAEQALRTVRAYGERFLEVNPLCTLSSVAHHGGEGAKALSFAHAALGVAEA